MTSILTESGYLKSRLLISGSGNNHYGIEAYIILESSAHYGSSLFSDVSPMLSNKTGTYNSTSVQQLYYFSEKNYYVVISAYVGSCDGCINDTEQHIEDIVSRAYVTHDKYEAISYYESEKLKHANDD